MSNINYELAKELKDAGFPLKMKRTWTDIFDDDYSEESGCYLPTLSELIEACGKSFTLESSELGFRAFRTPVLVEGGWSATPEEAVARLWLELNKKDE